MKKYTFGIASSALSGVLLAVLFACNVPTGNVQQTNDNAISTNQAPLKATRYSLTGTVQMPKAGFTTKANFADLVSGASVTMLDPSNSNNAVGPSVSTDASGNFVFTPTTSFTPVTNQIYVLEASKRAGANPSGSPLLALRTYVRWNGTAYTSITTPSLFINTYTTALTIIAARGEVTPLSTINTISVTGVTNTPTAIAASGNAGADLNKINNVTRLVQQSLYLQADPVANVTLNSGVYSLNLNPNSVLSNNGAGTQMDRLALPSLNIVLFGYNGFTGKAYDSLGMTKAMRDDAKDKYNSETPDTDVTNYRSFLTTAIGAVFPDATFKPATNAFPFNLTAAQLAATFTPDVYTLDMSKATSFGPAPSAPSQILNGRLLADDVVDVELKVLSGASGATDGVNANDRTFSTTFPYLAGPQ